MRGHRREDGRRITFFVAVPETVFPEDHLRTFQKDQDTIQGFFLMPDSFEQPFENTTHMRTALQSRFQCPGPITFNTLRTIDSRGAPMTRVLNARVERR
jgi:hypothetical protein